MKRAVQRELETSLAKGLLKADFGEEDTVIVEAQGGARAQSLTLTRKGSHSKKPAVEDSLDIDVTRDSVEDGQPQNGSGNRNKGAPTPW